MEKLPHFRALGVHPSTLGSVGCREDFDVGPAFSNDTTPTSVFSGESVPMSHCTQ